MNWVCNEDCCEEPIINKTLVTRNRVPEFTLTIKVHMSNYSNGKYLYWYVHCPDKYNYSIHPFRNIFGDDSHISDSVSGVVTDNSLIRLLLTYLTLEDDQLSLFIGNTNIVEYRSILIKTLINLAD